MGNLGGTFDKRIKQLGIKKQVDASLIVQEAQEKINEIFGEHGRDNLKVISYRNGVLKIAASSNAWAAECQSQNLFRKRLDIKRVSFIINPVSR